MGPEEDIDLGRIWQMTDEEMARYMEETIGRMDRAHRIVGWLGVALIVGTTVAGGIMLLRWML